jgi:hypothetical protein
MARGNGGPSNTRALGCALALTGSAATIGETGPTSPNVLSERSSLIGVRLRRPHVITTLSTKSKGCISGLPAFAVGAELLCSWSASPLDSQSTAGR